MYSGVRNWPRVSYLYVIGTETKYVSFLSFRGWLPFFASFGAIARAWSMLGVGLL